MEGHDSTVGKERQYTRVSRLFFISYIAKEGEEQKTPVSLGRTLNVSSTGVGMEVYREIPVNSTMVMDIGVGDSTLSAQGTVIHAHSIEEGKFYIGIQFDEPQEKLKGIVIEPH